ncbi:sporulation protein [Pilimelia anulata]|uniref:Sporulation protein n=1 Tax=Pilimelia anulata TaxID=53371 RepID=A0A8J3BAN6_9ACTN|nr:sporulation protein [Pilimelia anulata]GGJ90882.1 sporulation protein [Pilimelia anulata]
MVFTRLLGALGVGVPRVATVLAAPAARPGELLAGEVRLTGGRRDAEVARVAVALVALLPGGPVELDRLRVAARLRLGAGQRCALPFDLALPWSTPFTEAYGAPLAGHAVVLRTEVVADRTVARRDPPPLRVPPLPAHDAVLDALARLGFRPVAAPGGEPGAPGQRLVFRPAAQYAHACSGLAAVLRADAGGVAAELAADLRGRAVRGSLWVPHGEPGADRAAEIDDWFQRTVLPAADGAGWTATGARPANGS